MKTELVAIIVVCILGIIFILWLINHLNKPKTNSNSGTGLRTTDSTTMGTGGISYKNSARTGVLGTLPGQTKSVPSGARVVGGQVSK